MLLAPPLPQPCSKKILPELFWSDDEEEEQEQQPDTDTPFPATLTISLPPPHDNEAGAAAACREIIDSSDEEEADDDSSSDSESDDDSSSGSSDEYTSSSSSDEEDDDGPRRKKARRTVKTKKKTGMRKGVPTMVELEEAEKVHPEWEGLEAFTVFLQQGLASETATAAAAAAEGEEKGEEPDTSSTAVVTTPIAIATVAAVETLSHHMRPQEMLMPFKEAQREAIKAKAATMVPKAPKPPREERKPLPYKKIRRMVFHESMKGKEHIFKDGDHESACQCISVQEAKQQQQQQRHHHHQENEAGVVCGDEGCLNRSLQVECTQSTCRFAAVGECQNQRMLKREGKAFSVFKTQDGRGWGVQAGEDIQPGQFLMEYVGEVISDEEVERRMWQAKQEDGACFYMVDLMGATVDAKFQGNEARFVNHSCAPNCQLQKWVVNGEYRLGLFSIQPIKAGEEVHWDYQFASYGEPVMCRCGAANCRKILAGKAREEDNKDGKVGAGGAAGGAPVSQRVEKMQRAVAEAEAFRSLMKEKPPGDMNAMVLYFNGRTSKEEMVQARRSRLFITRDGPRPAAPAAPAAAAGPAAAAAGGATNTNSTITTTSTTTSSSNVATIRPLPSPVLQARLEALLREDAAKEKKEEEEKEKEKDKENQMIQQQQATTTTKKPTNNKKKTAAASNHKEDQATSHKHAQAQLLHELQAIATQRGPLPASTSLGRYQRKGLLTLREKRYHEVMTLPFAKRMVGEERVNGWHESRWQSLSDMVVYMRQSQVTGLWTDFNEDICFNCGCSGDLICCDACSSAYHVSCAGLFEIPEEDQWFCVRCRRKAASTQHGNKEGSTRRRAATGATATRGMA